MGLRSSLNPSDNKNLLYQLQIVSRKSSVAQRSKATVCGRLLAGVAGSNPDGGMDICVVCCMYRQKARCRRIKTNKQVRMKYRIQKNNKKTPGGCKIFTTLPDRPWSPFSFLYNGNWVFCPWGKETVSKRAVLYLYSPFGPSWPLLG